MNIEKTRINIINCAKTYPDGTRGLQPVSLTIEPGEVIALLGPSGCGKTTLLRLLAGLESADPGSQILFADQDVTHLSVEKRGIGMVFQSYALFPQMTVQANIAYGLKVRGVPDQEQKQIVAELVDLVRLNGMEKKRPAELSGGQRQRVALARAVAVKPRVLLLDEPMAALDAKLKEALRDELAQLLRRLGITTVHVTHDQHEALAIADRLAIMSAGQIVQVGDGASLYRKPAHPFVAQFLGRVNRVERDDKAMTDGVISFGDNAVLACPEHLRSQPAILLRPEDFGIGPVVQGYPRATVERRIFLGDRVQFQLRTPDQQLLMAEQPGDTLFREGEVIGLHIDTARFLPAYDN